MSREWVLVVAIAGASGCSLVLDFSAKALPKDAAIDTPWTAEECAFGGTNDTFTAAYVINPGTDTGPAAICPTMAGEDDDYFAFTVPANTNTVTVAITDDETLGDLDLALFDANDSMLASSRAITGNGEKIVCPNPIGMPPICPKLAAGKYVFEVFPGVPGAVNKYSFSVTLQ